MKLHLKDKITFRVIIAIVFAIYLTHGAMKHGLRIPQ